jgi:hypothetical protein
VSLVVVHADVSPSPAEHEEHAAQVLLHPDISLYVLPEEQDVQEVSDDPEHPLEYPYPSAQVVQLIQLPPENVPDD